MNLSSLPDIIITKIVCYLELKDLLPFGDCSNKLREIVYKSPEIWTSDLLFPIGDKSITDKFIQRIIPRITRHYGILDLQMIDLPLTWAGYLMIFDQFAHSVNRIQIKASGEELNKLAHHLSVFAGNLAMLQENNKIPITFRQYALDDEYEYSTALTDSNYLGQRTLDYMNDYLTRIQLDDPPFERLEDFRVIVIKNDSNNTNNANTLRQLELLASFLSGRPININQHQQQQINQSTPRSPIPTATIVHTFLPTNTSKRSREDDSSINGSNKYIKHDDGYYSHRPDHLHTLHQQPKKEAQQQQNSHHISYRSYA
ncbi:unnamed protein product [Mucor hiemalis]